MTSIQNIREAARKYETHGDVVAVNDAIDELERLRRLAAWLDVFEAETRALPARAEDVVKGCSSYNWRMSFVREARAALEPKP